MSETTPKPYLVVLHPNTSRAFHAAAFADRSAAMTYCAMLDIHLNIDADIFVMHGGEFVPWNEVY